MNTNSSPETEQKLIEIAKLMLQVHLSEARGDRGIVATKLKHDLNALIKNLTPEMKDRLPELVQREQQRLNEEESRRREEESQRRKEEEEEMRRLKEELQHQENDENTHQQHQEKKPLRIVRTGFLFDASTIEGRNKELSTRSATVEFGWIRMPRDELLHRSGARTKIFDVSAAEIVQKYIDLTLREEAVTAERLTDSQILNRDIVDDLLKQEIIIENSPPQVIKLNEHLKQLPPAAAVGLGVSVGTIAPIVIACGLETAILVALSIAGGTILIGGALALTVMLTSLTNHPPPA